MKPDTIIAHISDLHLKTPGRLAYGRVDTAAFLVQTLETLASLPQRPDALLVTGDLTDFGRSGEYEHLVELLRATELPIIPLAGNHDDRARLRAAFSNNSALATCPSEGFIQYSVTVGNLRLLALDTLSPGKASGSLCRERLDWLAGHLAARPDEPTIVAMHHPPFRTYIGHMDDIGLVEGLPEFTEIMAANPQVGLVACGHLHRFIVGHCGGRTVLTAPAPAHQVALDLDDQAASRFVLEPPGFLLHAWSSAHGFASHQTFSGTWEGPYPFHDENGLIDGHP